MELNFSPELDLNSFIYCAYEQEELDYLEHDIDALIWGYPQPMSADRITAVLNKHDMAFELLPPKLQEKIDTIDVY